MHTLKPSYKEKIRKAAKLLLNSKCAIVLTGAGISTESGIPDFRGDDGIWKKYPIETFGTLESLLKDPSKFWKMAEDIAPTLFNAEPNPGHYAIAELEKMNIVKAIITQNVDELHQKAGSIIVYEVHGNINKLSCLGCRASYNKQQLLRKMKKEKKLPPLCDFCATPLKPSVVLFGESLPNFEKYMSIDLAKKTDVMLIAGSSLSVAPVCDLPLYTVSEEGKLIIINDEPTYLDERAEIVINNKTGTILPLIVEEIKKIQANRDLNT
ncbi:MAG: NAD-dependent deacylase [Candidatus Lokiarchaeota archaeon]|nr:NAD-dependent deacylase [Candidatus Lokiarchaeota archaeon]MCK4479447.1 NAD-dependent deacylase [Candidatus Lokiarchaeota archaeon]